MIEGPRTGRRFLGNGTSRALPSIWPTQVPPDLGNSLTTYSGTAPDSRCTRPALKSSLVRSEILEGRFNSSMPPSRSRCSPKTIPLHPDPSTHRIGYDDYYVIVFTRGGNARGA